MSDDTIRPYVASSQKISKLKIITARSKLAFVSFNHLNSLLSSVLYSCPLGLQTCHESHAELLAVQLRCAQKRKVTNMVNLAIGRTSNSSKKFAAAMAVLAVAGSIALAPAAQAKRLSFEMPAYNKLIGGAGPETNDVHTTGGASSSSGTSGPIDLRPLTLNGSSDAATGDEGLLKGEVEKDEYAARGNTGGGNDPNSASGRSKLMAGGKAGKALNNKEKAPNVAPLALQETDGEAQEKVDTIVDAEKQQLQDLWQATILRNPDIQFVINKLQPTSDQSHATAYMMKALGQALFGIMSAAPLMTPTPSPMMFMGSNAGASLLSNLFASHEAKAAKKYAISQEQATILYKIVRDVADKLVEDYRNYKREIVALEAAQRDFEDLQRMAAEANPGANAAEAIKIEYTIRRAKRDLDYISENIRRERQALFDLGGADAVAKLDQQLAEERNALYRLAGDQAGVINPPLTAPPGPKIATPDKKSNKPM
jgi:hypothetical protein